MGFTDFFIRRPVFSIVCNIIMMVLGVVTLFSLTVRQYPQVEFPVITVTASFEGAGPEVIEAQLTQPLEEALSGLEGLDYMTSQSEAEQSKVKLFFKTTRSLDAAASDIRDRLSRMTTLPDHIPPPRVIKADADSEPVVYLALYGKKYKDFELYDYALRNIRSEIESVPGVASVELNGGAGYEMHLVLDPVKMAAHRITPVEISQALRNQNFKKPAGRIIGQDREFLMVTRANMVNPEDFDNLVLSSKNGYVIKISDVGKAFLRSGNERFRIQYNGQSGITLAVSGQSKSNPVAISQEIQKTVTLLKAQMPPGMSFDIAYDRSIFISKSLTQVYHAIFEAVFLVLLVVFFFLRSFRASFIPLVTIPISLVGVFFIIFTLNFSINILTLLALVLAIGMVVDDAIVVLENIYRYLERGFTPMQAALKGARDIRFSVIAMTLTLAAVYTPIALFSGMTGRLFTEFALTLAGSVIISGIVALTLSPMMCAYLLKPEKKYETTDPAPGMAIFHRWGQDIARGLEALDGYYKKSLQSALKYRTWVLVIMACVGSLGYLGLYRGIKSELSPQEDQGIIRAAALSPFGASLEYLKRYIDPVDQALGEIPEVEKHLSVIQVGGESYFVGMLAPWEKRNRSCQATLKDIEPKLSNIAGVRVYARCPSQSFGGSSERPLNIVLQSNRPFEEIVKVATMIMQRITRHPGVNRQTVDWDVPASGSEYTIEMDRMRMASLQVDPDMAARILDIFVSGRRSTFFEKEGKQYPVRVWVKDMFRRSSEDILSMNVKGYKDQKEYMVPLSDLIRIKEVKSLPERHRFGGLGSVSIMAGLNPGYGLGEVYREIREIILPELPAAYKITETGELRRFLTEQQTILSIFVLALLFIFFIMAMQFESFLDPLVIMVSVPFALSGGLLTLWVVPGCSLNIYSQIGLLTLIGLITKHGILLVDFANKYRGTHNSASKEEAVIEAGHLRLRPIIMTTLAMVLGSVPLALATGPGSEARRQIGWVMVGGLMLGTVFTLYVVPLVYTLVSRKVSNDPDDTPGAEDEPGV